MLSIQERSADRYMADLPDNRERTFYQRLNRLFRSGPAIRRKIKGQDYKNFYDNQVVQNNLGYYGASAFKREASPFSTMGAYGMLDRMSRYAEFAEMDSSCAEVASALNVYADESCASDENGKVFHVFSENPQVQKALEELFFDVLDIEFNGRRMIRNLVKNGDYFCYIEVVPDYGVINVEPLPVNEVEREEGFDKHDPYAVRFRLMSRGGKYLENWQMMHMRILGNDMFLPYGMSFLESARRPWRQLCHLSGTRVLMADGSHKNIEDVVAGDTVWTHIPDLAHSITTTVKHVLPMGVQPIIEVRAGSHSIKVTPNHGLLVKTPEGKFIYKQASKIIVGSDCLVAPIIDIPRPFIMIDCMRNYAEYPVVDSITESDCGQTWDLEVEHAEHNFVANGIVTHNTMLEDSMLVYRLVRSPERRVFYVDVSAVHPNDIPSYMEAVKESMRGTSIIEQQTGRQDYRYNPMAVLDDYFIPSRPNGQTKIESLAGGQNITATEDVEYILRKLIAALMVPKAYLTYDEAISSKSTLAQEDIRFSRTIATVQKIVVAELNKLAMIHLFALGFSGEDLINFNLAFSNPSTVAVQQKLALISSKIEIAGKAWDLGKETGMVSMPYIQKEILGFRPEQIAQIRSEARQDQIDIAELAALAENPPYDNSQDSAVDIFDKSNYQVPKSPYAPDPKGLVDVERQNQDSERSIMAARAKERAEREGRTSKSPATLGGRTTPIKFNATPSRNRSKEFTGARALAMPDFKAMLDPANKYNRDVFGGVGGKILEEKDIAAGLGVAVSDGVSNGVIPYGINRSMQSTFKRMHESFRRQSDAAKVTALTNEKQRMVLEQFDVTEEEGADSVAGVDVDLSNDDDSSIVSVDLIAESILGAD